MIVGNNITNISLLKQVLDAKFSIKDLGTLKYFLGFEVARSSQGISACQKIQHGFTLRSGSSCCQTNINTHGPKLKTQFWFQKPLLHNPTSFRKLIRKLLYLTHTRLDIYFVVCMLNQFHSKPTAVHFQATLRILWHIKSEVANELIFKINSSTNLIGFINSA